MTSKLIYNLGFRKTIVSTEKKEFAGSAYDKDSVPGTREILVMNQKELNKSLDGNSSILDVLS